ncbi:MAG TPA: DUF4145 domain-containing protein, partial [Noviherbaspirillum sp.]
MVYKSNFSFLAQGFPLLAQLGLAAEQAFAGDPNTTLIKLRQLGEAMAQDLAVRAGVEFKQETSQADLLYRLQRHIQLDPEIRQLFHTLRTEGNRAVHQFQTHHRQAMDGLKVARALAIWFHQSVSGSGADFKPGPFIAPADPSLELRSLQSEIDQLKARLGNASQALESNQQLAALVEREKAEYEQLALQMDAEARTFEALARQHEAELQKSKAE